MKSQWKKYDWLKKLKSEVYLEVDMSKESEESNSKFSITLKPELNKALEEEVNRKDRKKNFIVNLLETFPWEDGEGTR